MASGLPLVATRVQAHTQVLDSRECVFVDPDPDSMAEGLLEALESPSMNEVAARAKRKYDTKYSRERYEQCMRKLITSLAS